MNRIDHLLLKLAEECAEVQKCCTKAIRFGMQPTIDPDESGEEHFYNNEAELHEEVIDLLVVLQLLENEGVDFRLRGVSVLEVIPLSVSEPIVKKIEHYISVSEALKVHIEKVK